MKGILIEPGKEPVVTTLPDTLQGIEALLRCPCEQKVLPRTPAVLVYGIMGRDLNRMPLCSSGSRLRMISCGTWPGASARWTK